MRDLLKSRRYYCTFVALSFLATFALPLLLSALYNSLSHLNLPIDYFWFRQFILSLIQTVLDVVKAFPTALLLFAAMRWTFWYSVPVVFGGILYTMITVIRASFTSGLSQQYIFSLIILLTVQIIISLGLLLFYLKITRVVFLRVKNNFITVPVMLIIMLVVGKVYLVLSAYFNYLLFPIFQTGFSLSGIIDYIVSALPDTLLGYLYVCIVYVILYFGAKYFDKRRYHPKTVDEQV